MRDGETTAWHASPEAADEASFVPSGEVVSGAHLPVSVGHARVERGRGTSMGKTFTSVERMRVVGRERGRLLVLESCVTADVTYGSTFHPLVRVELSADEAGGTRLRARGSVAFVKPVNGFIKGMVRRGARDGMLKGYAKMRTLLDRAIERMAHQRLGEGEGEEERQKEAEAAERTAQAQEAAAAAAAQEAAAVETLRVPSAAAAAAETLPPIPLAALLGRPLAQLAWALSAPLQALDGRRGAGARAAGPGRAAARARAATASALGASALLLALQVAVAASAAAAGPRAPGPARALAAWAELPASPRAAVAGAAVAAVGRALANVVALGLPRLARSLRRAAGGPPRALVRARERRAAKARAKAARAAQAAEEAAAAAAAAAHAAAAAVSSAAEAASLAAEAEAQAGAAAIADDDEAAPAVRFEGYAEAMARAAREADAAAEAASLAASGGRAEARELEGAPKSAASIFAGNWTAMVRGWEGKKQSGAERNEAERGRGQQIGGGADRSRVGQSGAAAGRRGPGRNRANAGGAKRGGIGTFHPLPVALLLLSSSPPRRSTSSPPPPPPPPRFFPLILFPVSRSGPEGTRSRPRTVPKKAVRDHGALTSGEVQGKRAAPRRRGAAWERGRPRGKGARPGKVRVWTPRVGALTPLRVLTLSLAPCPSRLRRLVRPLGLFHRLGRWRGRRWRRGRQAAIRGRRRQGLAACGGSRGGGGGSRGARVGPRDAGSGSGRVQGGCRVGRRRCPCPPRPRRPRSRPRSPPAQASAGGRRGGDVRRGADESGPHGTLAVVWRGAGPPRGEPGGHRGDFRERASAALSRLGTLVAGPLSAHGQVCALVRQRHRGRRQARRPGRRRGGERGERRRQEEGR